MGNDDLRNFLERIATSLERIADSIENVKLPANEELGRYTRPKEMILQDEPTFNAEEGEFLHKTVEEDLIERFLSSKNIKIKVVPPEDAADSLINSLAEFLGSRYDALSELLSKVKSNMQIGGFITLSIKDYTQKNISDICQFCTLLHEIAFLEQYKYFKSPQFLIKAKTTTLPKAQNFFSGKWLERFVLQTVQKSVNTVSREVGKDLDFSYLINPQIILPNGNDFELDLIFHVNGLFYWIEAKTGDFQQHISKYSKMAKMIGLDYKHSIMVLTDIRSEKVSALTSLFSMTVYGLSQLEIGLTETIKKDVTVQ